ncbi:hypothetical protein AAVH_17241 [Aphelenchoides avenae]|nr:hypothetical protein AAVH_17241 [Aphelenchus avenae]
MAALCRPASVRLLRAATASTSDAYVPPTAAYLRRYAKGVFWQDAKKSKEAPLPHRSFEAERVDPLNAAEHARLRNAMVALLRKQAEAMNVSAVDMQMPKETGGQPVVIDFQSVLKQKDGKNANFNSVGFVKLVQNLQRRFDRVYVVARPSGVVRNDGYQERMKAMRVGVLTCEDGVKEALYAACVTMNLGESAKLLTNEHFVEEKEALLHDAQMLLAAWFRFNVLPVDRKMTVGDAEAAGSIDKG